MPNYQYRCKNCSYEFEELQRITEPVLVTCPSCKTENLVRLISGGGGLHFKGSGFYLTDYKKSNSSNATSTSSTEEGKDNDNDNSINEAKQE